MHISEYLGHVCILRSSGQGHRSITGGLPSTKGSLEVTALRWDRDVYIFAIIVIIVVKY